ncbi:MAG: S9 family peptidase [Candidatus Marinimicrobia bacterium]|nr:S9 family peptidase [Candidatus Neomarinimicrobiota bacterium]
MNMKFRQIKPYGTWKSPVSSESLVESSLRLGQINIDHDKICWTEGRPSEKGRTALMEWSEKQGSREISHVDWDIRTRAHEYGGGAFLADKSRRFYIDNQDQQLYEILATGDRKLLTGTDKFRYADPVLDEERDQLYAVGEDHSDPNEVRNMLLKVSLDGSGSQLVIAEGHDFYSNPQISPDGHKLLFLTWDHPHMPWDGTQLWLGDLDKTGNISHLELIAGVEAESVFQPRWDPNGDIYFISDRNGWWNLVEYSQGITRCILEMKAEFGLPQWIFGMSTYAVLNSGELVAAYRDLSGSQLIRINAASGNYTAIELPYSDIDQVRGSGDMISFIGHTRDQPGEIVAMDLYSGKSQVLRKASETDLDDIYISSAEMITFEPRPGELTYAWYYPPLNPDYQAPPAEKPPLIVLSHGGPTGYSSGAFSLIVQYWTTRGFAIVDVNYSGSTGFGRKYRQRLVGNWGIRDVEDCAAAAAHLVDEGKVDPERLIIKGGSAGGYTTLAALTFTDVFKAGASYYGVGDLELLTRDTHKFESRYLDRLVGAYPAEKQLYRERSPINHTEQLDCPVIFLQGLDDPVVPPNQAETMVEALRAKGIPVAYVPFEGESHGFRQASTIIRAIESEFYFYAKIFGIEPADSLDGIEIYNL